MARKKKSMRLGGGGRFEKCVESVKRSGAKNPEAVCAVRGRKKYGKKKMTQWSVAGRKRATAAKKRRAKK